MDKNLYILTGSNYYEVDIFLDKLKSENKGCTINYFRTNKEMSNTDIQTTLSKVIETLISNSDYGFDSAFSFDDEDEKSSLTIFETSNADCLTTCIKETNLLSDTNKLVIICPYKPSDKANKALKSIDDENIEVKHIDHLTNEKAFRKFCADLLSDLKFKFDDNSTKDLFLDLLEHECCFSLSSNWEIQNIELNSYYKNIIYDKGYAFNIIDSVYSYSNNLNTKDLKDFFSTKSKGTKRQILIKLLSQEDSFEASAFLKNEFKLLDVSDLKSFLSYFCYCLEEYVKSTKKINYNRTAASPFKSSDNLRIKKSSRLLNNLTKIRDNHYLSKESILTSFSLELHKNCI